MKKKIIQTDNYTGIDRRNGMPRLTEDIRTWWPIYTSVAGMLIVVGIWMTVVKATAVLATTNACDIKLIDNRVIRLETELPTIKEDIKTTKNNVEKLLQSMSAVKAKLGIYEKE